MKHIPLSHANERPDGIAIDTIVIHSMYAPRSTDPYSVKNCVALLERHKVSAHFIIGRRGAVYQCVEPSLRAWHAGVSKMPYPGDSRENVNDFSIGIELIGAPGTPFTPSQYKALTKLVSAIGRKYPIHDIVGHEHIAPVRKVDPGAYFDWKRFARGLPKKYRFAVPL